MVPVTYTFSLTLQACTATTISLNAVPNQSFAINSGANLFTHDALVLSNLACNVPKTYSLSFTPIGQPVFLAYNTATRTFSVNATLPSHIGNYVIRITGSVAQPLSISTQFTLTITNDCAQTSLIDMSVPDVVVGVSLTRLVNIAFSNTKEFAYSITGFCGSRSIVFTPALPSFMTFDGAVTTLTIAPTTLAQAGTYTFDYTVSLVDYPLQIIEKSLTLTVKCAVVSLSFSSAPPPTTLTIGFDA